MQPSHSVRYKDEHGWERQLVIRLEPASGIPRFEQLRAQLSVMIAVGRLQPGSRLPTVRDLANQLEMAPGTVARTYRELEHDGAIITRGRAGTFVADEPPHSEPVQERRERVAAAADAFVFSLTQAGLDTDEISEALEEALDRFREQTSD